MQDKKRMAAIMVVILLLIFSGALAKLRKDWQDSGGWGTGMPYPRVYHSVLMDNNSGERIGVEQVIFTEGVNSDVQLLVKMEKSTRPVHQGWSWYVERLDVKIVKGDKAEIKGARINFQDKPAIFASEIKIGEAVLVQGEANGLPVWTGWRLQLIKNQTEAEGL